MNKKGGPHTHHKPSEERMISGEVKVHGGIQVSPTESAIQQHNAEREEDNTYKNATQGHETASLLTARTTLFVTTLYFAVTCLIFWQSKRSADAAKQSADTATTQLEVAQRPWVGISGNDNFRLQLTKGEPLKVVLIPKNFGTAPALNEISVNKMEEASPSGHTPNFNAYTREEAGPPTVLFPGSASTVQIDTTKPSAQGNLVFAHLTDEEIRQIRTGIIRIYLYGSIWYEDTFHKGHRTDYCFMYHPETSSESAASFIACSEHNYAD